MNTQERMQRYNEGRSDWDFGMSEQDWQDMVEEYGQRQVEKMRENR